MQDKLLDGHALRFRVEDKLPHQGKMLLIDGTAYKEDNKLVFSMIIPGDSIFTSPGKVLAPLALVEMLAQLCGAQHVFEEKAGQEGGLHGYLVGIDKVLFPQPVRAGDRLDMTVFKILEMKDIKRIRGEIFKDDRPAGQAELTLFEAGEWIEPPAATGSGEECAGVHLTQCFNPEKMDAVAAGIVDSIYEMEYKEAGTASAVLCFSPGFPAFSGHFPGHPLLPGVAIIYAGQLIAGMIEKKELDLCAVKKAKFAGPIYPNDRASFNLTRIDHAGGQLDWYNVKVMCREQLAATYTIGTKPAVTGTKQAEKEKP